MSFSRRETKVSSISTYLSVLSINYNLSLAIVLKSWLKILRTYPSQIKQKMTFIMKMPSSWNKKAESVTLRVPSGGFIKLT